MLMLLQTLMNFILLWKTKGDVQQNVTGPQQGHIRIIRALHVTNDLMMLYIRNRLKNISILNSGMNRMNCEELFYGAFLPKNSTSWTQCIIILLCSMKK